MSADPLSTFSTDVDRTTNLAAGLTAHLTAGTYRVTVTGVGAHDPLSTGYSSYGSVGAYTITTSTGVYVAPPAMPTEPTATPNGQSVVLAWKPASNNSTSFELRRSTILRGKVSATVILPAPGTPYPGNPGAGTYRYEVRALNAGGTSAWTQPTGDVVVSKARGT